MYTMSQDIFVYITNKLPFFLIFFDISLAIFQHMVAHENF